MSFLSVVLGIQCTLKIISINIPFDNILLLILITTFVLSFFMKMINCYKQFPRIAFCSCFPTNFILCYMYFQFISRKFNTKMVKYKSYKVKQPYIPYGDHEQLLTHQEILLRLFFHTAFSL